MPYKEILIIIRHRPSNPEFPFHTLHKTPIEIPKINQIPNTLNPKMSQQLKRRQHPKQSLITSHHIISNSKGFVQG